MTTPRYTLELSIGVPPNFTVWTRRLDVDTHARGLDLSRLAEDADEMLRLLEPGDARWRLDLNVVEDGVGHAVIPLNPRRLR